jgi:O-antigen/teichoic acid export membrane protein
MSMLEHEHHEKGVVAHDSLEGDQTAHTNNGKESRKALAAGLEAQVEVLRKFVKDTGFYAISSLVTPLVSLVLAPFLTHHLSSADYGMLTVMNTLITLAVLITQLGLGSAFFRVCELDYPSDGDRRYVLGTVTILLALISLAVLLGATLTASFLARIFLKQSSLGGLFILAATIILLQNLTIPGLAWLRRNNHPLSYSLLSISNLLITLLANVMLVGVLHLGLTGSLLATLCGYAAVVLGLVPVVLLHAAFKVRTDIVWSLLTYGVPLIFDLVAFWVLQLSDRYLLSLFSSFTETARYAVVYTLGSAVAVVPLGPFTAAWPVAMFAIARREDAVEIFKVMFRWFGLLMLFSAFGLSLLGKILLDWLFPPSYHAAANIIPIIALSIAFYGTCHVFMVGISIKRKVWLAPVLTTIAALVNIALNLLFIPSFGAIAAGMSTLIAFAVLAAMTYVVNQRVYPVPFEISLFIAATLIGIALYIGSDFLGQGAGTYVAWAISFGACIFYGGCLMLLGLHSYKHLLPKRLKAHLFKNAYQ